MSKLTIVTGGGRGSYIALYLDGEKHSEHQIQKSWYDTVISLINKHDIDSAERKVLGYDQDHYPDHISEIEES